MLQPFPGALPPPTVICACMNDANLSVRLAQIVAGIAGADRESAWTAKAEGLEWPVFPRWC